MAVTNTLTQFKSILKGGGARPNLFEVSIPRFPGQTKKLKLIFNS